MKNIHKTSVWVFGIIVILSLAIGIIACQNDDDISSKKYSESEIKTISESLKVGVPDFTLSKATSQSNGLVIFTLWSRNKRAKCERFGICDWFPKQHYDLSDLPDRYVPCFFEKVDDGSLKPFVVELKEDVSNLPSESYEFIVSEDIEIVTEDVTELEFSKILVKKGKYPCDPKIGEFGGYIIPLYGIK